MTHTSEATLDAPVDRVSAPPSRRPRNRLGDSTNGRTYSEASEYQYTAETSSPYGRRFALASDAEGVYEGTEWTSLPADLCETFDEVERSTYLLAKRILDLVVASVALLLLSPVIIVTAAIIKLTDGGSIFYVSPRVGFRGREFDCFKFRSMVENADELKEEFLEQSHHGDSRTFKIARDPRLTAIGWFIRKFSIDELPQLLNVLRGDMSLVGPRPPVPREVAQYSLDDMRRLEVQPGLTCIWQVSGRSDIPFPEQLKMDLEYIETRSIGTDVMLLLRTVPAVLSTRGAY